MFEMKIRSPFLSELFNIFMLFTLGISGKLCQRALQRKEKYIRCEPPKTVAPPLTDQTTVINNESDVAF